MRAYVFIIPFLFFSNPALGKHQNTLETFQAPRVDYVSGLSGLGLKPTAPASFISFKPVPEQTPAAIGMPAFEMKVPESKTPDTKGGGGGGGGQQGGMGGGGGGGGGGQQQAAAGEENKEKKEGEGEGEEGQGKGKGKGKGGQGEEGEGGEGGQGRNGRQGQNQGNQGNPGRQGQGNQGGVQVTQNRSASNPETRKASQAALNELVKTSAERIAALPRDQRQKEIENFGRLTEAAALRAISNNEPGVASDFTGAARKLTAEVTRIETERGETPPGEEARPDNATLVSTGASSSTPTTP